jgi:cation diffusion facilitator family transporter
MSSSAGSRDTITIRSSWISLGVSFFVMLSKFGAYSLTHSTAVLSDAVESIVNVIAAFVAVFVMRAVSRPADEEHPYGHGKLEYFSAAFEGGLIAFASLAIGAESVQALVRGEALNQPDQGALILGGAAIVNLLLALHLRTVGRKHKSEALLASSAHVLTDFWTTVAVMGGLGLVMLTNLQWIDPVIALFVAGHLGYSGYRIVRKSAGALMDEVEPESLRDLAQAFQKHKKPWVIDVHNLKVIRSGHFHHIDGHLVVPEFWDVAKTHEYAHDFEAAIVATYPFDGEIAFHIDPCGRKFCSKCAMPDCPIRARQLNEVKVFRAESLIRGPDFDGE